MNSINDIANVATEIKKESGKYIEELRMSIVMLLAVHKRQEATEKIVKEFLEKETVYSLREDNKIEIWIYKEGIYLPQGGTYIKEFCRNILGEAYTTHLANQVKDKIFVDTLIDSSEFFKDSNPEQLPVMNGILDLKTKKILPFTHKKIFFNKLPFEFDPEKKCENIIEHFKTVLKDESDLLVMQELFGFLLWKEYFIEKAFMFLGSGRNGKGKTLELMKLFLGAENVVSIPIQKFEEDQYITSEIHGKMANLAGDISSSVLKNTGRYKELTGRDLITAQRKNLPPIYFINYAKLIFSCNELPRTYDKSKGFWERWIMIDFVYTFKTKEEIDKLSEEEKKSHKTINPHIIKKLTSNDELSGLLNWALIGLDRLRKNEKFSTNQTSEDIQKKWDIQTDSLNTFYESFIEEDSNEHILKEDFQKVYTAYCKKFNAKIQSDRIISKILQGEKGIKSGKETSIGRNNKRNPIWEGIKWNVLNVSLVQCFPPYIEKIILGIEGKTTDKPDIQDNNLNSFCLNNSKEKFSEEMVVTEEDIEENPSDSIIQIISENDQGNGVDFEVIKDKSELPEDRTEAIIDKLRVSGDIFEVKPERFKLK